MFINFVYYDRKSTYTFSQLPTMCQSCDSGLTVYVVVNGEISKSSRDFDLDRTMLNVKLVQAKFLTHFV